MKKFFSEFLMMKFILACCSLFMASGAWAITPYIMGDNVGGGTLQSTALSVETKLKSAGFKVIGKYFPKSLPNYGVIIATDKEMLKEVGSVGGHAVLGSAIRVGVKDDGTVSYTNPDYWYRAYFRNDFASKDGAVKELQEKLAGALGAGRGFGGDEPASSLASYRYMVGMEKLDSYKNKLNEFDSFDEAVKTVRDNLNKGVGKTAKVYEVVMPDRKVAVFGVSMSASDNNDGNWIKKIEQQNSIAGLPYEIYVVNNVVSAPHGRFRIALSFPDVKMGQFMRISSLPNTILENLSEVAGVEKQTSDESW